MRAPPVAASDLREHTTRVPPGAATTERDRLRRHLTLAGNATVARALGRRVLQRVTIDGSDITTMQELDDAGFYPRLVAGQQGTATEETVATALIATDESYSEKQWHAEVLMRSALIDGMAAINTVGFRYNWDDESLALTPGWEAAGGGLTPQAFVPRANVSPLAAVRELFQQQPEDEARYLDCSSALVAVRYHALAEALNGVGFDFDREYPRERVVISVEGLERVVIPHGPTISPPADELTEEVVLSSIDQLLPGDQVYLMSYSDYDQTHTGPEAAWAGEHAVYLGNGLYQGFGVAAQNLDAMIKELRDSYNKQGLKQPFTKRSGFEDSSRSMTGTLPGIDKRVRRLKMPTNIS
jgi:hypothetical protein